MKREERLLDVVVCDWGDGFSEDDFSWDGFSGDGFSEDGFSEELHSY